VHAQAGRRPASGRGGHGLMGPARAGGWAAEMGRSGLGRAQDRFSFFSEIHFQYKQIPEKLQLMHLSTKNAQKIPKIPGKFR
jgi:hypothetical protein